MSRVIRRGERSAMIIRTGRGIKVRVGGPSLKVLGGVCRAGRGGWLRVVPWLLLLLLLLSIYGV